MIIFTGVYRKFMISFEKIEKVLIIRLSSLGDILLTTPIVRSIKNKYPQVKIDFLLKPQFSDVYNFNPNINKIMLYNVSEPSKTQSEILKGDYDLIIDLQSNIRTYFLLRSIKAKKLKFKKPSLKKYLLVNTKINLFREIKSIPLLYSKVIGDEFLDEEGLEIYNNKGRINCLPQTNNVIGFCPGAKHFTKRWLSEYFIQLGNMLADEGFVIYLLGGNLERELCANLNSKIKNSVNCSTENDLILTAEKMANCQLIVTNDSALMHVASSIKIPIVAIFGSSVREFGFAPYNVENTIAEIQNLSCRPCSHVGKDKCPKGHFDCMREIKPEMIYEKIKTLIKKNE